MQAATLAEPPTQATGGPRRWPTNVSRITSGVFVVLFVFVYPLCYCPHYYLELSLLGLVPLLLGPRLYRFLGAAIIVTGLLTAEGDRRGGIREREQIRQIQAQADAQTLREHPERRPSPAQR